MQETSFLKLTPKGIESNALSFPDALQLICSGLLHLMQGTENFASDEEEAKELKVAVYDSVNEAMGALLHIFDPDRDPNPDVDINEIIAREDVLIQEQAEHLKATNPLRYKKQQKEVRKRISEQRARTMMSGPTKEQTAKILEFPKRG